MPARKTPARPRRAAPRPDPPPDAASVVAELKRLGSARVREGMARYAIPSDAAFGIAVGTLRQLGKRLGPSHELALELWASGWYEARLLAVFVAEPERVTAALMDRWCKDFDNWAVCDTACFHLFDRTPHALGRISAWAKRRDEFVRRAAFALLASLALHDKEGPDAPFARCLPLIERAASDQRNFVKKAVSWALKGVGGRSRELHGAALALARQLSESEDATERWVGKDALRDLSRPATLKRVARRSR
jgi:3-methyladenine DNA glycosylase AlkD